MKFLQISILFFSILSCTLGEAQYLEDFEQNTTTFQKNGIEGWNCISGDGDVLFTQKIEDGHASLRVDAGKDLRNIWYTFIQQGITEALDLEELQKPDRALRIEARVRPSHAPRRINLHLPVAGKTGHHANLMEFDLPKAGEWYTISMTVKDMKVNANERLIAQVSMMDWGNHGTYQLDVDYIKVDIIDTKKAGSDKGNPVRYRPPLAAPASFAIGRGVAEDVSIDSSFPNLNLNDWMEGGEKTLPVDATKTILLGWDFTDLKGQEVNGEGQLEIYTYRLARLKENPKDFGEVRICEIIAGDSLWQEAGVDFQHLLQGLPYHEVVNEQTIVDTPLAEEKGGKVVVTLSQPVLQRLVDGTTSGLAIRPLGLIDAALIDKEAKDGRYAARIRMNVNP